MSRIRKKTWAALIYSGAALLIALLLQFLARSSRGFAEWYAQTVFPFFPNSLGRLVSPLPFSLFELLLCFLALLLLVGLTVLGAFLAKQRLRARALRSLRRLPLRLLVVLSTLFLIFVLTTGVNYNRDSFAVQVGVVVDESGVDELVQLYRLLVQETELVLAHIQTDAQGYFYTPKDTLHADARQAMRNLSYEYGGLISFYPNPKPVAMSKLLSYLNIAGFYAPFTMEANYNHQMPDTGQPYTICHELAHLSGYAREDEANFVAYLACLASDEPDFHYSAYYNALRRVLSALRANIDSDSYRMLYAQLPEQVLHDFAGHNEYWSRFEGRVADTFTSYNDAYLRANGQTAGVQSYGQVVDLLLAYYRDREALAAFSSAVYVPPVVEWDAADLWCNSVILWDLQTDRALVDLNSAERAQPASVTKILTAVVALELIEDLEECVTMQARDYRGMYDVGASLSGFEVGEEVSYRDLLYTLMLISGCDSAYALAHNLCGSLEAFAARMNEKCRELGLSDSNFVDPSGLTAEGQYSTVADMVRIVQYAWQNEQFRTIFESNSYTIQPTNLNPETRTIGSYLFIRLNLSFDGPELANGVTILGGKTGYTHAAGLCLAVFAELDGWQYIAVAFGGPGDNSTEQFNFLDVITVLSLL